jgi:hypothetical protein
VPAFGQYPVLTADAIQSVALSAPPVAAVAAEATDMRNGIRRREQQDFRHHNRARARDSSAGQRVFVVAFVSFMLGGCATAVFPASALWTSKIMCSNQYHLEYGTSYYQRGITNVSFQCISGTSSYAANVYAIMSVQILLALLVLSVGVLLWRLLRKTIR